jgi:hypothetical protein
MRIIWAATAAALLIGGVARAESQDRMQGQMQVQIPAKGDAAVGIGVICNTSQQAEQFVTLRSKGTEPEQAMQAVNAGARDQQACGVAAIAYIRDATIETKAMQDQLVQIVRVNVVAGFNGSAWQRADMIQYAVLEGGGESI